MSGRPKQGIDYAGWSVNIFDGDTKIDKLLDAQGWIGWSIYFYLCQMAYKFDGYFYRWAYDDSASTARRMGGGIGSGTVEETVRFCLQIGLFDQGLFDEWSILTSRGIQRRFLAAIQGRRVKTVIEDYWLLGKEESKGLDLCAQNGHPKAEHSHLHLADDHLHAANATKGKESKGKESKGKESKGKDEESSGPGSAVAFFLDRINGSPSHSTLELLADFERDLGPEVCIRAMLVGLDAKKPYWNFIHGILKNKRRDGIRSLAAWDAHEARRNEQKENSNGTGENGPDGASGQRIGQWL